MERIYIQLEENTSGETKTPPTWFLGPVTLSIRSEGEVKAQRKTGFGALGLPRRTVQEALWRQEDAVG